MDYLDIANHALFRLTNRKIQPAIPTHKSVCEKVAQEIASSHDYVIRPKTSTARPRIH